MPLGRWLLLVLLVALDVWASHALAPAGDGPRLAIFGAIFAAISAAFGFLASGAATAVVVLWRAFTTFGRIVWDFGKGVARAFVNVGGWLKGFYQTVLRPAVSSLYKWFGRLKSFLENTFGPVLRFLESVRNHILKFYEKWIRPIFDTIAIARRVLQIFDKLGFEWARKLDRQLADLEERIYRPIRLALQHINQLTVWVNRIMTLDGLIQRITLIASLVRDVQLTTNLWWNAQSTPLTGAERDELLGGNAAARLGEHFTDLDQYFDRRGGALAIEIDEFDRLVHLELQGRRIT
jgi:PAS domain-containing protein